MKFPKPDFYFPTKDEAADYLEAYARYFTLPVRYGVKVDGLHRNEPVTGCLQARTSFHARNVIVATGAFHTPYKPTLAQELDPAIFQMHSADYRNAKDVPVQNVVVVGAGNSGAEIALELAKAGRKFGWRGAMWGASRLISWASFSAASRTGGSSAA